MRYQIVGIHPESDSWWVERVCETIDQAEIEIDQLEPIDNGLGHWDIIEERLVDQWFKQNNIDARWTNEKTFWIGDIRYLYLRHKDEGGEMKIFSPEFSFLIDTDELEEFMAGFDHKVDYYCFEFGGKIYYSGIKDKPELNLFKHIGKAKDISGFDYLGVHGGYELCVGSRTYDAWCDKAKFLGITTLGICEKHTLAGALKFQLSCAKNKIKSIIGETLTIKQKEGGEYKVKVYVANEEGWKSLLRLHKRLNIDNDGKFVEQEELIDNSKGLYCVFQHDTLLTDDILAEFYHSKFIRTFFQLDTVEYKAEKRELHCLDCLKKALELNIPLALICDSYYLDQEDNRVKQILQFIGNTGFEYQSDNQHFKSLEEVSNQALEMFETKGEEFAFSILEKGLEGLREVSDGCNFNIELGKTKLPKYILSEEERATFEDTETFFWYLINEGLQKKIVDRGKNQETYLQRIETEYDVISRGGFIDYFLILNDIVRWCEKESILVGAGRGSGAGSLIAYLLDLVHVDPIEYGLIFERFLNEGRIGRSLPDLDTDIQGSRRDEVKRYIESKYGEQNVCSIGTYGTFKLKAAFRDLCRMKGVPTQTVNYAASMLQIREGEDDFNQLFIDASKASVLKEFINEYSEAINDIELIFGQPKNASVHAAGVVITPSENGMTIYDWMPTKKMDGILISEWEGPELESAGFLKEDILGIKQLDKFNDVFKLMLENNKTLPSFESIEYNDPKVLKLFQKGWNQDLFHFGSVGLTSYSQDVKPDSFEELIAMIALYRPGAMEFGAHESYVKIKYKKKEPEYDWGTEEITKSTYGLYVYQEQVMKMCQVLAGFSLTEADDVRKYVGKKQMDKLIKVKDRFVRGCVERGCVEFEALKIWSKIEAFGSYAFNRSHSCLNENCFVEEKQKGLISIKDVKVNDKVLSFNHKANVYEYQSVLRFFNQGKKEVIKYTLSSGRVIECTKDHRVFTKEKGYIEIQTALEQNLRIVTERRSVKKKLPNHFYLEDDDLDFRFDFYTGEAIDLDKYRALAKKRTGSVYLRQIAWMYYENVYKKSLRDVLYEFYDIPMCPITGEKLKLSFDHSGAKVRFNTFSETVTNRERQLWNQQNHPNVIAHVENMKEMRRGSGNPSYRSPAQKGKKKSVETREKIRLVQFNRTPERKAEIRLNQSISAKKRLIHGHTGKPHSEETKGVLRSKTISNHQRGIFPKTRSKPHNKIIKLLEELDLKFDIEYRYGKFLFDLKVDNFLIEVQGDFYHCNPQTKYRDPVSRLQINNLQRDIRKRDYVKKMAKYTLIEIWEQDINNDIEKVKLCLKELLRVK